MAFNATYFFAETNAPPGRRKYRLDLNGTVDDVDDSESAGFINNLNDNQNLQIGDRVDVFEWSGVPFASDSTLTNALMLVVTNVISNTAAANAGNVNMAEIFLASSLFSSGT
jgi:hypothetical protein